MGREASPERVKYHDLMGEFIALSEPGSLVYDIGKSHLWDYRERFKDFKYRTIDRDPSKSPDEQIDIEGLNDINVDDYLDQCDALLCNGVIEQCDDPMAMLRACHALLKGGGLALFGMVLLGYPEHTNDRFRFTEAGALLALTKVGFINHKTYVVRRNDVKTYIYALSRKR